MATGINKLELFDSSTRATKLISSTELIKQEVETLLSIEKYSLFFGNNIGLSPEKYLYLTNRIATFNLIKLEIETLFVKYSKASLAEISMEFDNSTNAINITLTLITNNFKKDPFKVSFNIDN